VRRAQHISDLRQLLDPINTTGVRSVGGQTAVQEAQLIGYGDSFSEDTDEFCYKLFDTAQGSDEMMTAFVSHLMLRADALRKKKLELLTPLLFYLIRAEQLYEAHFESSSRDPHNAVNAFNTSPWGLFTGYLLNKATTSPDPKVTTRPTCRPQGAILAPT
jgi:hypothetical protein